MAEPVSVASYDAMKSRLAALEQLLEVFEGTTIDQAERLESALRDNELKALELLRVERERGEWAMEKARGMEKELEIARHIQTSILPRLLLVGGLEIAARMNPADEVGGDYYDVIPTADGCWIGIGDVTGHGLNAGLIMLMTQSIAAALSKTNPLASPSAVLQTLNSVLFDNIRKRLLGDDHVTLTLLHYTHDGRIVFAGAHEDILICRADGSVECLTTPGTWVGAIADITRATRDSVLELRHHDIMVLYTDGVTESMNAVKEQFGLERLGSLVARWRRESVAEIARRIFDAVRSFSSVQNDDETVLVTRYVAPT